MQRLNSPVSITCASTPVDVAVAMCGELLLEQPSRSQTRDQAPGRAGIVQRRFDDRARAVHLPDRRRPVVILPEQVALPVAVEVAGADQAPGRAGIWQRRFDDRARSVPLPDGRRSVLFLPEQVALPVAV